MLFLGIVLTSMVLVTTSWNLVGKPMVHNATHNFAHQIQNIADSYPLILSPIRARYAQRVFEDLGVKLEPSPSTPLQGERPRLPYFTHLERALSQLAGDRVTVVRRGDTYSFDFPSGDASLRFSVDHSRLGTAPGLAILTMLVLALLGSLVSALLIAKLMARPIETIALGTESRQEGGLTPPLTEVGARELRNIVRNFNHITSQNRELMSNNAIMLAGISHDLRAPITRARMALELARERMDANLAERIERSLVQMDTLIAQYLDYTGGSLKEEASPVNIAFLLKEIVQTYKEAEIELKAPAEGISLASRAFVRCAQNLLDNAVKHGAGKAITVRFEKAGAEWILEIADRGPGIPEAQIDKVFQPFLRLDRARTQPGSGLGLSIVQEICRAQGWRVALLPRPNGGLIARLSMPVVASRPHTHA